MIKKICQVVALATTILTVITFGLAFFTPPLSGPGCTDNCYVYPYLNIAERYPRDYYWMYPAMGLALLFFFLTSCIHEVTPTEKKLFSRTGMSIALLASGLLITDYFLQLSVVQPSLLQGEADGISLLTQFNPHGIFIALDELGFIFMSIVFLCLAPIFSGTKADKTIRNLFIANFMLAVLAFGWINSVYGLNREYLFEVAIISINWFTLIPAGVLLYQWFKRH